ncbi:MAG: DUF3369 domain-containing protein [Nannocystaceae bacterium]
MVASDDDDPPLFADEVDEADEIGGGGGEDADERTDDPWNILVVDDEPEVHAITRLALGDLRVDGRPLAILSARDGESAKLILLEVDNIAVILLDVVMESEHAGLHLARWIRSELANRLVRLVLRTGQAGSAPEQRVMVEYDINDYRAKTELTVTRLVTTVVGAIRSYRDLCVIESQKHGLERVIDATASLFERGSFTEFIRGLLIQIAGLLSPRRSAMFVQASGPLFELDAAEPIIIAGTGRFAAVIGRSAPAHVPPEIWSDIDWAIHRQEALHRPTYSIFGLCHEGTSRAAVYVETDGSLTSWENHLLELFCRNATVALDNFRLHRRQLALLGAFERFVPKRELDLLGTEDITLVAVGDHVQRDTTVVFADLRAFTSLAEQLTPAATFDFINEFFAEVVPALHDHGGVVDKYLGDGLMALFPGSPADAVRAALAMIARTRAFAARHPDLPHAPRLGVGVHCGPLILGLCGAADRLEFTAISDSVNIAARIERLTRPVDADLLVSDAVYERLPPELQVESRPLGCMPIRGKNAAVEVFEVFAGDDTDAREAKRATRDPLGVVAEAIRAERWEPARALLVELLSTCPEDQAVRILERRCWHQLLLLTDSRAEV